MMRKGEQHLAYRTSNEHRGYREDLFGIGVGRDVAEADRSQTCAREVKR